MRCWWCDYTLVDGKCLRACRGVIDGIDVPRPALTDDEPLPIPVWRKYVDPE